MIVIFTHTIERKSHRIIPILILVRHDASVHNERGGPGEHEARRASGYPLLHLQLLGPGTRGTANESLK